MNTNNSGSLFSETVASFCVALGEGRLRDAFLAIIRLRRILRGKGSSSGSVLGAKAVALASHVDADSVRSDGSHRGLSADEQRPGRKRRRRRVRGRGIDRRRRDGDLLSPAATAGSSSGRASRDIYGESDDDDGRSIDSDASDASSVASNANSGSNRVDGRTEADIETMAEVSGSSPGSRFSSSHLFVILFFHIWTRGRILYF